MASNKSLLIPEFTQFILFALLTAWLIGLSVDGHQQEKTIQKLRNEIEALRREHVYTHAVQEGTVKGLKGVMFGFQARLIELEMRPR